ncbi:MAG: hypothetical protein ACOC44_12180 [Promethearchaeia archaeon]
METFEKDQEVIKIGNVNLGGQPGENPTAMVASVFYKNHKALLDEKKGLFDTDLVETEINEFLEIVDETDTQAIIDVIGGYPEALVKECAFIADLVDCPFLVDGLSDSSRIPAMKVLNELGLLDRAILNSIDPNTSEGDLEKLKKYNAKNAVLLTFGSRAIFPKQKVKLLKEKLIPSAKKANIKNTLVDTAVLDLPSIKVNAVTAQLVKEEFGLPVGYAPSNAIFGWDFVKKYGSEARYASFATLMGSCISAGCDFILFGPIKFAKFIVPSLALLDGIDSYYRKRILRESISDKVPFKKIF